MARPNPSVRMQQILDAASEIFESRGLQRTRMSDVAESLGVAQGTLYHYFESKEAVFYTLLERGARPDPFEAPDKLPVPTPPAGALDRLLDLKVRRAFYFPRLDEALERTQVADARAELQGILEEAYGKIRRGRVSGNIIERTTLDDDALRQSWFVTQRGDLLDRFAEYVTRRMEAGHFRPIPDANVAGRFIVETMTYFGRLRFRDPGCQLLGDEAAVQDTAIQMVLNSFTNDVPTERSTP